MKTTVFSAVCVGLFALSGCAEDATTTPAPEAISDAAKIDGAQFLLTDEPEGAADVIAVRESAQNDDNVVIVGRIGGMSPWVDGRAAFSIVDGSLKACSDIPGDACPTPWDYCCASDKLPTSTALIKVVDENGDLVKADARELLNVKELSTVVVKGKAQRDEEGNLNVLASGVYVKQK